MQVWRNWQTRKIQVLIIARLCGFKSLHLHHKKIPLSLFAKGDFLIWQVKGFVLSLTLAGSLFRRYAPYICTKKGFPKRFCIIKGERQWLTPFLLFVNNACNIIFVAKVVKISLAKFFSRAKQKGFFCALYHLSSDVVFFGGNIGEISVLRNATAGKERDVGIIVINRLVCLLADKGKAVI